MVETVVINVTIIRREGNDSPFSPPQPTATFVDHESGEDDHYHDFCHDCQRDCCDYDIDIGYDEEDDDDDDNDDLGKYCLSRIMIVMMIIVIMIKTMVMMTTTTMMNMILASISLVGQMPREPKFSNWLQGIFYNLHDNHDDDEETGR